MSDAQEQLHFVWQPPFTRTAKGLLADEDVHHLEHAISVDPTAGDLLVGTGGVRKIRIALEGRGKSGGARVIYYYRASKGTVYLLAVFAKNVKVTVAPAEHNVFKALTAAIDREL